MNRVDRGDRVETIFFARSPHYFPIYLSTYICVETVETIYLRIRARFYTKHKYWDRCLTPPRVSTLLAFFVSIMGGRF
jgi:hypothetical protein